MDLDVSVEELPSIDVGLGLGLSVDRGTWMLIEVGREAL